MKLTIGIGGKTYEVEVEIPEDDTAPKPHYIPAQMAATGTPAAPTPAAGGAPKKAHAPEGAVDESKVCRSPIAGMVTRIDVTVGQQVQASDVLLILEAMKMETNVTSPVAGKVKTVKIAQGDGVHLNQILLEFE